MTDQHKKPSERIHQLCSEWAASVGMNSYAAPHPQLMEFLDEEYERRAAFEAELLKRIDILERSQRDALTRIEELERAR